MRLKTLEYQEMKPTIAELSQGISVDETARIIGIHRMTLFRMIKRGAAPQSYRAGKRRFFRMDDIRAWQEAHGA